MKKYFCVKCEGNHKINSGIGKKHQIYKGVILNSEEFLEVVKELTTIWKWSIQTFKYVNIESFNCIKKDLIRQIIREDLFLRRKQLYNRLTKRQYKEAVNLLYKSKNKGFPNIPDLPIRKKIEYHVATREEFEIFFINIGDSMLWDKTIERFKSQHPNGLTHYKVDKNYKRTELYKSFLFENQLFQQK